MNEVERLLKLIQNEALEIGKVKLSSGKISDYYIDAKKISLIPVGAYLTAKLMLDMMSPDIEAVAGLTLGADPIVASITLLSYIEVLQHPISPSSRPIPGLIIRKEPKKHGTRKFIEGPEIGKGAKVAVVDDVVTSGGSLLRSIDRVEAEGYKVTQVMAILDRLEGGRERLAEAGYRLEPILTRQDLDLRSSPR